MADSIPPIGPSGPTQPQGPQQPNAPFSMGGPSKQEMRGIAGWGFTVQQQMKFIAQEITFLAQQQQTQAAKSRAKRKEDAKRGLGEETD